MNQNRIYSSENSSSSSSTNISRYQSIERRISSPSPQQTIKSFSFDDLPFTEAIGYLENAFMVDIQYDSSRFKDCRLFAEFTNAPLNSILDALCATLNSTYTKKENIYYIKGQGCQ